MLFNTRAQFCSASLSRVYLAAPVGLKLNETISPTMGYATGQTENMRCVSIISAVKIHLR